MRLLLLRHANADTEAARDEDRELSAKGVKQAKNVARFCKEHAIEVPLVVSSPVVRALQTAKRVAEHLGSRLVVEPWLACGMEPETALEKLRDFGVEPALMLVGHEPDFSALAAHLLGLSSGVKLEFRKATLMALDVESIERGGARLDFSIPSRLM